MRLKDELGWLTYCLNIHPTQTWAETRAAITGPLAAVKAALSPNAPFAAGLRFSGQTVRELSEPGARDDLKRLLADANLVPVPVGGFPYGPFHGTRVKEEVYKPDWLAEERLAYTCALADLMADIATGDEPVSLSTVPGTFRPLAIDHEAEIADNLLRAAAHCVSLRDTTGVTVALAIEPEPCCFIETIAESVDFFRTHLLSDAAARRLAELTGLTASAAAEALPRHLGLCYDVCHAAVEFENAADSLAALRDAGVPIHKLQLSAALQLPEVNPATRAAPAASDEPFYLHQVVSRRAGQLDRLPDLAPALARGASADGEEWRVHFHVPLFVSDLGAFRSTQDFLAEMLTLHRNAPISAHLEVETYTWDVLPPSLRDGPVEDAVVRELGWVLDRLAP
jgi:sugar phosphate isomerase/epimerase